MRKWEGGMQKFIHQMCSPVYKKCIFETCVRTCVCTCRKILMAEFQILIYANVCL